MTAIFDTHAHYDDDAFNEDREQLLAALPEQGIARVVDVGASLASCRKVLELMERYDYIYGAIGVHPSETAELDEESYSWLKEQCRKRNAWQWERSDWIITGRSRTMRHRRSGSCGSWIWRERSESPLSFIPGMRRRILWIS